VKNRVAVVPYYNLFMRRFANNLWRFSGRNKLTGRRADGFWSSQNTVQNAIHSRESEMKDNRPKRACSFVRRSSHVSMERLENRQLLSVSFGTGTAYPGLRAVHVAVADMNGDSKPDIVAIGTTPDGSLPAVAVFPNKGDGTFGPAVTLAFAPPSADAVTVGDFNGDGVPDIAVACASGASVSVYMGVGTNINGANPSFTTPETMFYGTALPQGQSGTTEIQAGRFGGTSDDLVILDENDGGQVLVLPSTGSGSFGLAIPIKNGQGNNIAVQNINQFTIADFSGDGVADIAYAQGANVAVQFGEAGGLFSQSVFTYGPVPNTLIEDITAGVLTVSGKPDLVVANDTLGGSADVSVLLNNGAGSFGSPTNYPVTSAIYATLGDLDGDGSKDIAVYDPGVGIQVLTNSGSGTFAAAQDVSIPTSTNNMMATDLNGDLKADLVVPDTLGLGAGTTNELGVFIEGGSSSGGGGGGGGGSSVTGTVSGSAPASVIAGQKAKIAQTLAVTNGSSPVSGTITGTLYLSSDGAIDANSIQLASTSKKVKLKSGGRVLLNLKASSIPASTPNGMFQLIVKITDPNGGTTDAISSSSVKVAPAQIDLSGAFSKTPVAGKGGKTSLTFTVSDDGNTGASGTLTFDVETSPDGLSDDATVVTETGKKINIKAGKSVKESTVVTLPTGSNFVLIRLDPNNTFNDVNPSNNTFATSGPVTVA
jgi:hypothetical protein